MIYTVTIRSGSRWGHGRRLWSEASASVETVNMEEVVSVQGASWGRLRQDLAVFSIAAISPPSVRWFIV